MAGPKVSEWSRGYRDFESVEAMNETLLENINKQAKEGDLIYFLGDFLMGPDKLINFKYFRSRINCKKLVFILGNHDKEWFFRKDNQKEVEKTVGKLYDVWEGRIDGHYFFLEHYAHRTWNNQADGAYNLYAHSHGSLRDDPSLLSIDVGIDTDLFGHQKYTMYHIDEIHSIMKTNKRFIAQDHHA